MGASGRGSSEVAINLPYKRPGALPAASASPWEKTGVGEVRRPTADAGCSAVTRLHNR